MTLPSRKTRKGKPLGLCLFSMVSWAKLSFLQVFLATLALFRAVSHCNSMASSELKLNIKRVRRLLVRVLFSNIRTCLLYNDGEIFNTALSFASCSYLPLVFSKILFIHLFLNVLSKLQRNEETLHFCRPDPSHCILMADSVQLLSQSDYSICISILVEFY